MPKTLSFRRGLSSVLLWSIISAAFIGPGTVTTAAKAGASFQLHLLWALLFSTIATIILQEAAARITLASGKSLGTIVAEQYRNGYGRGLRWALFLAVAFGCAAYQAGNLLGAVSGLALILPVPTYTLLLGVGLVACLMLWQGSIRAISRLLALVVAFMGIAFLSIAILQKDYTLADVMLGALQPGIPEGGLLLVLGLVGTTIVPYNLFLASGISQEQEVEEMRWGISMAVAIGGLISMAILITGTQVSGVFSFETLSAAMEEKLGAGAPALFALGLFAAGISSAITAPLATAITARALLGEGDEQWGTHSSRFRISWGAIMGIGLFFGLMDVKPIPAIIAAQAINGALLPVVAMFLILAVNDHMLIPKAYRNGLVSNLLSLAIVGIACFLGLNNIGKALGSLSPSLDNLFSLTICATLSLLIIGWLAWRIFRMPN
ncbi:MAG: divalent metal cation transporter [Phaeodactylibacter sp.]|nr:divalent metal cation transporter [Phaeodactylibacter sp.]MCB9303198.1 divalent metal cation transporter [Lewinellaceae bacterium]HQU59765.1 divalent metal cation transporter [Saprospiraceae bacterium]